MPETSDDRSEQGVAEMSDDRSEQGVAETSDERSELEDADGRAVPLEGIERDLDTVDGALSALDADDLESAEVLASELEAPRADSPIRSAKQS